MVGIELNNPKQQTIFKTAQECGEKGLTFQINIDDSYSVVTKAGRVIGRWGDIYGLRNFVRRY